VSRGKKTEKNNAICKHKSSHYAQTIQTHKENEQQRSIYAGHNHNHDHDHDYYIHLTSPRKDKHTSISPLSFFTGLMPFLLPTNSAKALKAITTH